MSGHKKPLIREDFMIEKEIRKVKSLVKSTNHISKKMKYKRSKEVW